MHDKGGNAQQKCHNARAACNGIPVKGLIPNRPGTHKKSLFTGFFLFEHNVVGFHQWTESGESLCWHLSSFLLCFLFVCAPGGESKVLESQRVEIQGWGTGSVDHLPISGGLEPTPHSAK